MTGEIERIAASLTEAATEELRALGGDWQRPIRGIVANWLLRKHPELVEWRVYKGRTAKGVSKAMADYRLTPLGLQVRAHLEQHHAKD